MANNQALLAVLVLAIVGAAVFLTGQAGPGVVGSATDTDNDGLSDNFETYISHTNVTNWDTDGDNKFDSREVAWGRDPLDSASTLNCCGDGGNKNTIADADTDGLSDAYEAGILLTSYTLWDTDSDGYCDSHEIIDGYDPKSASSHPSDGHTGTSNCQWFR